MPLLIRCFQDVTRAEVAACLDEHREAVAGATSVAVVATGRAGASAACVAGSATAGATAELILARATRLVSRVRCGRVLVALKEYRHDLMRSAATWLGVPSRARRAVQSYHLLQRHGFRTAPPLALVEEWNAAGVRRSYLLTPWITEGMPIGALLRATQETAPDANTLTADWTALVRILVENMARLHLRGIWIPDYKSTNYLVVLGAAEPDLVLVDFDKICHKPIHWPERLSQLCRLRRQLGPALSDAGRRFVVRKYLEYLCQGAAVSEKQADLLSDFLRSVRPQREDLSEYQKFCRQHQALFPASPGAGNEKVL
jgi:hypothetical protein